MLDRLTVNPSLFMVKYDGFDCVYGIELFKDERVSNLQVLTEKVGEWHAFHSVRTPHWILSVCVVFGYRIELVHEMLCTHAHRHTQTHTDARAHKRLCTIIALKSNNQEQYTHAYIRT